MANNKRAQVNGLLVNTNYDYNGKVHLSFQSNVNGAKGSIKLDLDANDYLRNPFTVGKNYNVHIEET